MGRPFRVLPKLPNISEPIGYMGREPIFLTDDWREYFEFDNQMVVFAGEDHVKTARDGVDSLSTDYYTKAQSDNLLSAKASTSHTHAATDVTSGTFADARIPSLAISKISGLQTALNSKVSATSLADLNQTISDPPTQSEVQAISDKIDAILAVLR